MKRAIIIAAAAILLASTIWSGAQMFAQLFGGSVSRLPEGYRECNWIGLTGTQYIDTGYKASNATIMTVRFSTASATNLYAVAGGRNSNVHKTFSLFALDAGRMRYDLYTAQIVVGVGEVARTADVPATIIMRNGACYYDGNLDCSFTVADFSSDYNLFLGAVNTAGTASYWLSGKIHFCTIADGSGAVRNFVPCVNASSVPGMYDLVGATFYPNAGTGNFLYELK